MMLRIKEICAEKIYREISAGTLTRRPSYVIMAMPQTSRLPEGSFYL